MTVAQIGGNHYESNYQHWDLVPDLGVQYLEGCATKYLSRWRKKGGVQDIEKAMSYIRKIKERCQKYGYRNTSMFIYDDYSNIAKCKSKFDTWIAGAGVPQLEADICWRVFKWYDYLDLDVALDQCAGLLVLGNVQAMAARADAPEASTDQPTVGAIAPKGSSYSNPRSLNFDEGHTIKEKGNYGEPKLGDGYESS